MTSLPTPTLRNYIGGQWTASTSGRFADVENPSAGAVIARVPLSSAAETHAALERAHEAWRAWKDVPVARRVSYLFRLLAALEADEERIVRTIAEEMGKSLPDARAEVKRAFENIEVACGMPVLQQGDKLIGGSFDIDGEVIRLPMGVFAMIAPFNFPAMVPFWFVPYAIATGNCIAVKASKQVPCTLQLITEHIHRTGLPPGVFTLVNGDKEVAGAFLDSPLVQGVSIVGSTPTCREVARRCAETNKRFQAMGGAKNHLVVMPDARIEAAVRNMVTSCLGCAGQRCMASSAIVCVTDAVHEEVCARFVEAARRVVAANPLDPAVAGEAMVLGPVISARARQFILGMIDRGVEEGARLLLDGRGLTVPGCEGGHFVGPTVFSEVRPGMDIHRVEIFGPVVVILRARDLDEAIAIVNGHEYGNGASIYTQSGYHARKFKLEVEAGMIGINVGIPAPVACLPFGGMKASQFADIKAQGKAIVNFYTQDRIVTERYWPEA